MSSKHTQDHDLLTVGLAQIAPIWLNREATLAKIVDYIGRAAAQQCRFISFGEVLLPGYQADHYSRPDVTRLVVDRRRQNVVSLGE